MKRREFITVLVLSLLVLSLLLLTVSMLSNSVISYKWFSCYYDFGWAHGTSVELVFADGSVTRQAARSTLYHLDRENRPGIAQLIKQEKDLLRVWVKEKYGATLA